MGLGYNPRDNVRTCLAEPQTSIELTIRTDEDLYGTFSQKDSV